MESKSPTNGPLLTPCPPRPENQNFTKENRPSYSGNFDDFCGIWRKWKNKRKENNGQNNKLKKKKRKEKKNKTNRKNEEGQKETKKNMKKRKMKKTEKNRRKLLTPVRNRGGYGVFLGVGTWLRRSELSLSCSRQSRVCFQGSRFASACCKVHHRICQVGWSGTRPQ